MIKLNGVIVIDAELMNGNKIFNDVWNEENVAKIKSFRGRLESLGTGVRDREHGVVADGDVLRRTRNKSIEITGIRCHMGGCASVHVPVVVVKLHVVKGGDEGRANLLLLVSSEVDQRLLLPVQAAGVGA
jgi:hypothetical protein